MSDIDESNFFELLEDISNSLSSKDFSATNISQKTIFNVFFKEGDKDPICKRLTDFLSHHDGCWMDLIGCEDYRPSSHPKQKYLFTIRPEYEVRKEYRKKIWELYDDLVAKGKRVDALIQYFFQAYDANGYNRGYYINVGDAKPIKEADINDLKSSADAKIEGKDISDFVKDFVKEKEPSYEKVPCINDTNSNNSLLELIFRINRSMHEDVKYVYFLPVRINNNGFAGIACLGTKEKLDPNVLGKYKDLAFRLLYPFVFAYQESLQDEDRKKESEKSAKAAIMVRNMSHNIGSHVIPYLKFKLHDVASIIGSDVLRELDISGSNTLESLELPFLVGMGHFISYLQERQDFLATIATGNVPHFEPVNFKECVYDEINPDLRYFRHASANIINRPQNILLNYIAKSEGLSRENMTYHGNMNAVETNHDIMVGFDVINDDGSTVSYGFDTGNICNKDDKALNSIRNINVALPGGLVGRQALFSILENIIRNAAKHSPKLEKNLEFHLDFIDGTKLKEAKKDRISSAAKNLFLKGRDISELYILAITNNVTCDKNVLDKIKRGLNDQYVNEDLKLLGANKGLKEIRISSAWLRGDMDETKYLKEDQEAQKKCPLVVAEMDDNQCLRYIIALRKNRKVAIVLGNQADNLDDQAVNYDQLKQQFEGYVGYYFYEDKDAFLKSTDRVYDYIVVPDSTIMKQIRKFSPNRIVVWETNEMMKQVKEMMKQVKEMMEQVKNGQEEFEKLLCKKLCNVEGDEGDEGDEGEEIYIFDDMTITSTSDLYKYVKVSKTEDDSVNKAKFLYRTHLDSESDCKSFYLGRTGVEGIVCFESITGHNSSDRLVRREKLDERWYYSHLRAMKMRVAIIDERLFSKIHKVEKIAETFTLQKKMSEYLSMEEPYAIIDNIGKTLKPQYNKSLWHRNLREDIAKLPDMERVEKVKDTIHKELDSYILFDSHLSMYNHNRGVEILTIEYIDDKFEILKCEPKFEDTKFKNSIKSIGTIKFDNSGVPDVKYDDSKYDYLSIHQGLLDKIYDAGFEKKKDEFGRDDKKRVTKELAEKLLAKVDKADDYYPGLMIHSGRARPSKEIMPQPQPFLQYSALENAVSDTKVTLVNLFDYVHYNEEEGACEGR